MTDQQQAAAAAYRVLCLRGGGDCDGDILQIPTTLMCVFLFFSLDKVKSKFIHLLSFQLVLLLWKFVQLFEKILFFRAKLSELKFWNEA